MTELLQNFTLELGLVLYKNNNFEVPETLATASFKF